MVSADDLPPLEISNETRSALVDGVRATLMLLQRAGKFSAQATYASLLEDPLQLLAFIQAYRANSELADSIVKSKKGEPVRDEQTVLVCDVNLAQVSRLLIVTCAKKFFAPPLPEFPEPSIAEPEVKKGLGLFRKAEKPPAPVPSGPRSNEERKIAELIRFLAYDWQLPILPVYRDALTYQHVIELGADILTLKDAKAVAAAGLLSPADIRKARQVAGEDFVPMLTRNPRAVNGVVYWSADMYKFYRQILGDKAWDFFARDRDFFNVVAALEKSKARLLGDMLVYIAPENLLTLGRLNFDKTRALVEALKIHLGDHLPMTLGSPQFGRDILNRIVDGFVHLKKDVDQLLVYADLTCKALAPTIADWLARRP
jgi:hypothetical protein